MSEVLSEEKDPMSAYALLSLICKYVFDSIHPRERSAILIEGDAIEAVRIDRDFMIIRFEDTGKRKRLLK